jgi:hypothetical protein
MNTDAPATSARPSAVSRRQSLAGAFGPVMSGQKTSSTLLGNLNAGRMELATLVGATFAGLHDVRRPRRALRRRAEARRQRRV